MAYNGPKRKIIRLQNWNYSWAGIYFITICTKNREHFFGEIKNAKMNISPIGIIADILWYEIKNHFKNFTLGNFVVMPNHVHGVLIINDDEKNENDTSIISGTGHALSLMSQPSQRHTLSQRFQSDKTIGQQRFQHVEKKSISSAILSYKSAVSKHAHRLGFEFEWQSRFHENIIRNKKQFENVANYILNNPKNWKEDRFR